MSEDAQVRELVDDDRLERLRRSEDKTPREGEPAGARGAAPAGLLIAHGHRGGADGEGRGVASDLGVDRGTGARPQPRFKDCGECAPIRRGETDDQLVLLGATDTLDG